MFRNSSAVTTIPTKLIVYVIITAIIIALAAVGWQNVSISITESQLEKELGTLKVELELLQHGTPRDLGSSIAPEGSKKVFHLGVPSNVDYISFGADPDPDGNNALLDTPQSMMTDAEDNVIFYRVQGGSKRRIIMDAGVNMREGAYDGAAWVPSEKVQGVLVNGASDVDLEFELAADYDAGMVCTLAHYDDGVEMRMEPDGANISLESAIIGGGYQTVVLKHMEGASLKLEDIRIETLVNGQALPMQLNTLPASGAEGYHWVGGVLHSWSKPDWDSGETAKYSIGKNNAVLQPGDYATVRVIYKHSGYVISTSSGVVEGE